MESKSGVVGKFRSHYNTIEQVTNIKLDMFMKLDLQLSYQKLIKHLLLSSPFNPNV